MSPILKAAVDAAHAQEAQIVEKMRWRDKDGGLRMASKRQRRNMKIQNAKDSEIRSGTRTYDGFQFTRSSQPRGSQQPSRTFPDRKMGLSEEAIGSRSGRAGSRAHQKLLSANRNRPLHFDTTTEHTRTADRVGRKLSRLASRMRRAP